MKVLLVGGARPNFVKIAALMEAFRARPEIAPVLVHTGQHSDPTLSGSFFEQLALPEPSVNLGVNSGDGASRMAAIIALLEPVLRAQRPDLVVGVGDVDSTLACALAATRAQVRLAHVEAGLRSRDRSMPEEINRILTDAIAELHFCTERSAVENLIAEGRPTGGIFLVGNVMIDTLVRRRQEAERRGTLEALGLTARGYAVLTLHRPANVDDRGALEGILDAVREIQRKVPVVFPAHPRARRAMTAAGIESAVGALPGLRMIEPLGYLDFLKLLTEARTVLTDSGGIQEETAFLGIPCLTLRDNTERPVTLEAGTNRLAGRTPQSILAAWNDVLERPLPPHRPPPLWDGNAASRIAEIILARGKS